jgi:hypothetical protein
MRSVISIRRSILALLLCAIPVFGQQSTTNTDCNVNGQQVNCTSNTTTNAPPPNPMDGFNKQIQDSSQRLGAALAANAQRRAEEKSLESQIEFHVVYCEQNPANSITTTKGDTISCTEEFARTRALCSIGKNGKKYKFCALLANAPTAAPVAPSASLATSVLAPSTSAPTPAALPASTRPDPIPPASQAGPKPPTAPALTEEQKDAISYCRRNPTATITWNNGTVSPCSSVLGPQ